MGSVGGGVLEEGLRAEKCEVCITIVEGGERGQKVWRKW